jgi:type IV secretory pathway VirB3-like protein
LSEALKSKFDDLWPALAVGALSFIGYLLVSPAGFSLGDGPELAASAVLLGIPHPPGYPLFTNLGHLFAALAGDGLPGLRLLNILAVSAAAGFVVGALGALGLRRPAAILGALLFSASAIAVRGAVFVEVYGFALLGLAVVLWAIIRSLCDKATARDLLVLALCYGLALAHHITQVFFAPAVLYVLIRFAREKKPQPAFYALFAAAGLLGLSAYLYLPVRTAAGPAVAWFSPDNLERLGFVLGGASYGEYWGVSDGYFWSNAGLLGEYLLGQLPVYLVGASLAGFALLARRRPVLMAALVAGALADLYWAARYAVIGLEVFFLLGCFLFVFAAVYALGFGLDRLFARVEERRVIVLDAVRSAGTAAVVALAVIAYLDASVPEDLAVQPHGANLLRCSPSDAATLFTGDLSFPLLYRHYARDGRPDLVVADEVGMITSTRVQALVGQRLAGGADLFFADPSPSANPPPTARWGYGYLFHPGAATESAPPTPYLEAVGPGGVYADETAARYLLARFESPRGGALWEILGPRASDYAGVSPHAHLALGRWLLDRNPAAAAEEFRRAAELNPWMPSTRYGLALALLAAGDAPAAGEELEAALAGFAEPEVKALAARLLSELRWRSDPGPCYNP